ncbi:Crossover junction endonuclease mus81 [Kickxella alabastrina]|uniref:Crossover junction endonuclease mus81 n=1 Tax=Kickxella alabastrina TaxID=61397 RepID=A0ACC1IC43_9FUNG|nr:Crossover junction endonuclease mus81 [Kickxella alabastrina]
MSQRSVSHSHSDSESACANPLFFKWVNEWYNKACKSNAKTQYTLKKALNSLRLYPLRIENPQETVQLQGIGQGIANRLTQRMIAWRKENGIPDSAVNSISEQASVADGRLAAGLENGPKQSAPRLYVPRYRSGTFALLIGLFKTYCLYGPDYFIPKNQLIPMCEQYTDTPFHVAGGSGGGSRGGGSSHYSGGRGGSAQGGNFVHTAWSGMKTLETKSLVERQGGVKFCLTEEGLDIAIKVVDVLRVRNELPADDERIFASFVRPEAELDVPINHDNVESEDEIEGEDDWAVGLAPQPYIRSAGREMGLPPPMPRSTAGRGAYLASGGNGGPARHLLRNQSAAFGQSSSPSHSFSRNSSPSILAEIELGDLIHYPAGEYEIILIVDNREVHSVSDRNLITKELEEHHINIEIRPLTVGDYLWIARAKQSGACRHLPDIVLNYVVERKRMDDLCASIRDGRYKEQHSRIHGTGFNNVLYIVEGNDPDAVSRLGESAVNSALSQIQIHHGFHLKRPGTFEATLRLLRQTTCVLQDSLKDVYAVPDHMIGQKGFSSLKKSIQARFPHVHLAMTFDAYDVVSNKSGTLTVGEIYLRMLLTLRGISADKALAIGWQYQTPTQLFKALLGDPNDSNGSEKLLEDLTMYGSRRKLGPALGKRIAQFWTAESFVTSTN